MLWARLERPGAVLAVANMHLSGADHRAACEVRRAAAHAVGWAGEAPLLFGGDLNLRPAEVAGAFRDLEERFGIAGPTGPGAIDHLLVRGLEVLDPPRALPPERREVDAGGHLLPRSGASAAVGSLEQGGGLAVRLSDHAPVLGRFGLAADAAGAPFG